jgi:hypothetical protein
MSGMAMVPEIPSSQGLPSSAGSGSARSTVRATVAWFPALVAGSAVLGLLGGLIWGEFAPRVQLQEVSAGTAEVVNVESRAFFGGDVWFCVIAVVAGLLTGILGYRLAVASRAGLARAAMMVALIGGAVAGSFVMLWLGEQIGQSGYDHALGSSPVGTRFSESLSLGSSSALALWPLFTSAVLLVAEWGTSPDKDPGSDEDPGPGPAADARPLPTEQPPDAD